MQYRYTVRGGYDRLIKKKVEKGTLFAVPIAVLAIVGLAAFTSNTTTGPGIGSSSSGNSGQATVTKTFHETANNQPADSGSEGTTDGVTTISPTASGTTTQGSSSGSLGSAGSTVKSVQPTTSSSTPTETPTQNTGSTTTGSENTGGESDGTTTLLPGATPVTLCIKQIDPLTGQEICVN